MPIKYSFSMKATTIKIEGNLLREIEMACPPTESLTAFVRDVLQEDLKRRRMAEAAVAYQAFLTAHPDEQAWLTRWEKADLSRPPRKRRGRRS